MNPIRDIFYQIQYSTIFFISDHQENSYKRIKETSYPSASFAGRRIECFGDTGIDNFLEVSK